MAAKAQAKAAQQAPSAPAVPAEGAQAKKKATGRKALPWWQRIGRWGNSVIRLLRKVSSLCVLFLIVASGAGHQGPLCQVTRVLTSIADVSSRLGKAASIVIDSAADASSSASSTCSCHGWHFLSASILMAWHRVATPL